MRGIVRTDRKIRASTRHDFRFAQHKLSNPLVVAAIERGHPLTHSNAAQCDLGVQMFAHKLQRVLRNLAKTECGALRAACNDADVLCQNGILLGGTRIL